MDDGAEGGEDEVPPAGDDEPFEVAEGGGVLEFGDEEEFADGDEGDEGGVFEHGDEFVSGRGDDDAEGLGKDDAAHGEAVGHAEGAGGFELAGVDGLDAGADDFGHVGAFVDGEGEDAGLDWGELAIPGEPGWPSLGEGEVPEDDLDEEGCAAEEPDVGEGEGSDGRGFCDAGEGEEGAEEDAEGHSDGRELECHPDAAEDDFGEEVGSDVCPADGEWEHGVGAGRLV